MDFFGQNLTERELDHLFSKVDTDGSGTIDYSEFVVAAMSQQKLLSYQKLKQAFNMFDKDKGGTITVDEIQ